MTVTTLKSDHFTKPVQTPPAAGPVSTRGGPMAYRIISGNGPRQWVVDLLAGLVWCG